MKPLHTTPLVDYGKFAEAKEYYETQGFEEIAVPWVLEYESYNATRPPNRKEFYVLGGYMNASGEQGFLELMMRGKKVGRQMCITACFREEPVLDGLHHRYFMKLELIDTDVSLENLHSIITIAQGFFDRYLPLEAKTKVIPMDEKGETFDIVDDRLGMELGSYGIREHEGYRWIYATGLALPRLDSVVNLLNKK